MPAVPTTPCVFFQLRHSLLAWPGFSEQRAQCEQLDTLPPHR